MSKPRTLTVPAALAPLVQRDCVLPGESQREFDIVRQMLVDDIRPATNIEWLWILDLVELSWEVLRYRRLKQRTLEAFRFKAVETLLERMDGIGVPDDARRQAEMYARRGALAWHDDPVAAIEIEARLEKFGFDAHALNTEVYVHAKDQLDLFEQLMQRAQHRRMVLLREISIRREFAFRANLASERAIKKMASLASEHQP